MARSNSHDLGDGDQCPLVPSHGRMLVQPGTGKQYCAHQSHDGVWSAELKAPQTRAFWPVQWFQKAVDEHRRLRGTQGEALLPDIILDLPDLDLDMEFDL